MSTYFRTRPYAGSDKLKEVGWYDENSEQKTQPVGLKYPNELGIYDLSGNVWEWCEDYWHSNYRGAPADGSAWSSSILFRFLGGGAYRVNRGGSWLNGSQSCRVAFRFSDSPEFRANSLGFRLAMSAPVE